MKLKINKDKFKQFCLLFEKYHHYYGQYEEAEISFYLDEIVGGLFPCLLNELFNAWFPELQNFDVVEYGEGGQEYHYYGYNAFEVVWDDKIGTERLYRFFEAGDNS